MIALTPEEDAIRRTALRLRSVLGLKQSAFAERMGISVSTLANRETGKGRWPLHAGQRLRDELAQVQSGAESARGSDIPREVCPNDKSSDRAR